MDWSAFLSSFLGASFSSTIIGLLLKTWLDHRLTIERTRAQEDRQKISKQREASAAVADILGEWVRTNYIDEPTDEDRWKLQITYWKNILLLDKELLDILRSALALEENSPSINEIIVRTRMVILGLKEPDLKANELNNWLPNKKHK